MPYIYCIKPICEYDEGDCYYGSTEQQYLCNRMAGHRNDYRKYKNSKYHFITIFDIFDKYGLENCKIYEVEKFDNITKQELLIKESEYILNNPCINKANPKPLTKEDYKQKKQEYYQNVIKTNSEKLKKRYEITKKWMDENAQGIFNCECGGTYTYKHKARHNKTLQHKLGTDSEFKLKYEEEQKQKEEERKERVREYKKQWVDNKKKLNNI